MICILQVIKLTLMVHAYADIILSLCFIAVTFDHFNASMLKYSFDPTLKD